MPGDVNIALVASLLADPIRVNILFTLSDGRAFTAGELARQARVAPSTASMHLSKLLESDMLTMEKQGRHRYFRLANPAIVTVLEDLAVLAPAAPVRSLREASIGDAVRRARTCYNHIAGKLGVGVTHAFVENGLLLALDDGYSISEEGLAWFSNFGIEETILKKGSGLFIPRHIDWSERRHHIAGTFGAAITNRLFALDWIRRIPSNRAVCVTEEGQEGFKDMLDLRLD